MGESRHRNRRARSRTPLHSGVGVDEHDREKTLSRPVPLLTLEARIKRRLRGHLRALGFKKDASGGLLPPPPTKEAVRAMHRRQRQSRLEAEERFLTKRAPGLLEHFASGLEVQPQAIKPRLQVVAAESWESDLFRLATLTWSIPVSRGYGRRLRFLVWDDNNGKLIGVLALGDPVFNLHVRDETIGWTSKDRERNLVHVMDAYVLGAVPPYNGLLGGKLMACLIRTREVRSLFAKKYGDTRGIISGVKKRPCLVLVTTSSALGRSSVYNRLKLASTVYFEPVGYTKGWGHFHVPDDLFEDLRRYLESRNHGYANGHKFGHGPNWRLRTIRTALELLGINGDVLRHGIGRQVFVSRIATNAERFLRDEVGRPAYRGLLSVDEVSRLALERWIIPRAERRPEFKAWSRDDLWRLVRTGAADPKSESRGQLV